MIEHENIIYISYISEIGGVETFAYELAKKYKDRDVAVVCKTIDKNQLKRFSEICWVYRHTDQVIRCKTAIINYDVSIINYIEEGADIYQTIHADYEHDFYKNKFPQHDRIKAYIGITQHIVDSFKRCTGNSNIILGYNPLTIEPTKPYLTLVSATRLTSIKGKDRMIGLANALDKLKIDYIWYIFTNDTDAINSPNVLYMRPRLDVHKWIEKADYVVQLSDTEACSYTINEALYRNVPVIVTPLPYLEEIGYMVDVVRTEHRAAVTTVDHHAEIAHRAGRLHPEHAVLLRIGHRHYDVGSPQHIVVVRLDGSGTAVLGPLSLRVFETSRLRVSDLRPPTSGIRLFNPLSL